jgi:hypothetical protein
MMYQSDRMIHIMHLKLKAILVLRDPRRVDRRCAAVSGHYHYYDMSDK